MFVYVGFDSRLPPCARLALGLLHLYHDGKSETFTFEYVLLEGIIKQYIDTSNGTNFLLILFI